MAQVLAGRSTNWSAELQGLRMLGPRYFLEVAPAA